MFKLFAHFRGALIIIPSSGHWSWRKLKESDPYIRKGQSGQECSWNCFHSLPCYSMTSVENLNLQIHCLSASIKMWYQKTLGVASSLISISPYSKGCTPGCQLWHNDGVLSLLGHPLNECHKSCKQYCMWVVVDSGCRNVFQQSNCFWRCMVRPAQYVLLNCKPSNKLTQCASNSTNTVSRQFWCGVSCFNSCWYGENWMLNKWWSNLV